jgi:hypothetical protein
MLFVAHARLGSAVSLKQAGCPSVIAWCGASKVCRAKQTSEGEPMHPYENPLKIPKVEKAVTLWTHPDGLVLGSIYLHMGEPDRSNGEDPWSVMNGPEDFLAVRRQDPEELRFYNKASLIRIEYGEAELVLYESGKNLPCRVHMMDGSIIDGAMRKALPPERSRLYDYMNTDNPRFLKLYVGPTAVCLINKSYVGYIMTRNDSPDL